MQSIASSGIGEPGAGGAPRRRSRAMLFAAVSIAAMVTLGLVWSRSRATPRTAVVAAAGAEQVGEKAAEKAGEAGETASPAEAAVAQARKDRLLASRKAVRKTMLDLTVAGNEAEVAEPNVPHKIAEGRAPTVEELAMVEKAIEKSSAELPAVPADPDIMAGILATLHEGVAPDIRFGLIHAYKDMVRSLPEAEAAHALQQLNVAAGITP